MTMPSIILPAIAAALQAGLVDTGGGPLVNEVRVHEGAMGPDGKENLTIGDPGVLVACLGARGVDSSSLPKTCDATFVAYVITRNKAPDQRSRSLRGGDIAMLAAAVIEGNVWGNEACRAPRSISIDNLHTDDLGALKGCSVWSVMWVQRIEIDQAVSADLNPLRAILFTLEQGGTDTPKPQAEVDFPEQTA